MEKRNIRFSIRRKFFLTILIVSIVPVILFAIASISITYSNMRTQLIDSRTLSMDWLHDRLSLSVRAYTDQFYEYEVDKELKNSIVNWADGGQADHVAQARIRKSFETALNIDPNIRSIEVYSLRSGEGFKSTRASFYDVLREPGDDVWGQRNPDLQTNIVFDIEGDDLLVMHRTNVFATGRGAAVIVFRMRIQVLSEILEKVKSNRNETALLVNDDGKLLIASPGVNQAYETEALSRLLAQFNDSPQERWQDDKNLYFYRSVSNGKLRVVYAVPNGILLQALWQTISIAAIILSLSVLTALLLSVMFSQIISKPIIQLSQKMQVGTIRDMGGLDVTDRHDEIGFMQESFGIMIRRNQELIDSEIRSGQEKRDAQIRALQAQINPHFIYNTLQVIGGMSLKGQTGDIYSVVVAFSEIMRYSFNFLQEMVPFGKEIGYLNGYLTIQNYRFNDRVHFETAIPDRLMDAYIPKLILQPIVENCFEHGLAGKAGEWRIALAAAELENGDMMISVTDNGLGMSDERLTEIKEQLKQGSTSAIGSSSHIGLNNVHSRLRLRYGDDYGVRIENNDEGTGMTVRIYTKLIGEADT